MALPDRIDLEMMSGSTQEFEFVLTSHAGPLNISDDTIDIYVSPAFGKGWKQRYTSLPGEHFDPENGVVRVALTVPAFRSAQTWWYEVWRREDNKPHVVGELRLGGSVKG